MWNPKTRGRKYNVEKLQGADIWSCGRPDFHYGLRKMGNRHCRHIQSCIMLKGNIPTQNRIEKTRQLQICSGCHSTIIGIGFRMLKNKTKIQGYRRKQCNRFD